MVVDRKVVGAAAATFISSGMTPTVPGVGQTFTVNADTGYPATGAFVVVIDREQSNEEKILVSSRSGTTFTVGQRGFDGTTGQTHTSGSSTCEHALDAVAVQLLFDHVDGVEVDPHSTKLLNNARHDLEARHQFGSGLAFGEPVTPTALTPDIAGAVGTGNNPAKEDHAHNVPTTTASTITGSNAEGTAASFARADHNHAIGADTIGSSQLAPAAIDDENHFSTGLSPVIIASSSPGAVGANRWWFNTTTRALLVRNAGDTAWEVLSSVGTDQSYDPAVFNITHGNGVKFGRYTRIGQHIVGNIFYYIGTTTVFGANIGFGIPVAAKDLDSFVGYPGVSTNEFFGMGGSRGVLLASGTFAAIGVVPQAGAAKALDRINFFATAGSAAWGAGVPGPWGAGDRLAIFFQYEAANAEDAAYD